MPPQYSQEEFKKSIKECFDSIQSPGSFALFEQLDNAPNPGIFLKNGGTIGLPLSDRDAQAIIAVSRAAPFGKGEETIVDPKVRKTWEVSPTDFELRNPSWQVFLSTIVMKVSAGLGVDASGKGVSAELYKMLLYDNGAMFKPHQDSEKAPRMFATLVIALPSKHEGGEVRVTHAGKTQVFETSKMSDFGTSYMSWFSDVTHEVKPILSGYRLVLTYNLTHTTFSAKEINASASKGLPQLRTLLKWWKDNIGKSLSPIFTHLLEHQYTVASLCFDSLKGHDRQLLTLLSKACTEQSVSLYLANIHITLEGSCDEDDEHWDGHNLDFHKITEELECTIMLRHVVKPDGVEIIDDLDFYDKNFVQDNDLKDLEPDDEEYSGYTGNEGVSATHFYNRTVVIMVPNKHRAKLFFPEPPRDLYSTYEIKKPKTAKVASLISELKEEITQDPRNRDSKDFLKQICKLIIRRTKLWNTQPSHFNTLGAKKVPPFSFEDISLAITTLSDFDNKDLITEACEVCSNEAPPAVFQAVASALLKHDLHHLLPMLATKLSTVTQLSTRLDIIFALRTGWNPEAERSSNSPSMQIFDDWVGTQIEKALSSTTISSAKDGILLCEICQTLSARDILTRILPIVKRNVQATPMVLAFVKGIFDSDSGGGIPLNVAQAVFCDVVTDFAEVFSLKLAELPPTAKSNKRMHTNSGWVNTSSQIQDEPVIDLKMSRDIAALLCRCHTMDLVSELQQITSKIIEESKFCNTTMFENVFLPFLKTLKSLIIERQINVNGSPFQELFQQLLRTYVNQYVQKKPTQPRDWTREKVQCPSCQDCVALNKFLSDPMQEEGRFSFAQARREHLKRTVESKHRGFGFLTDTGGSPYTLVIFKTNNQYQSNLHAWNKRRMRAGEIVTGLGKEELREFLGERYTQIMSSLALTSVPKPSANGSSGVLPSSAKRQMPHGVIMIDDD